MDLVRMVLPVRFTGGGLSMQTTTSRIGPAGVFIRCLVAPKEGAQIRVAVQLPDGGAVEAAGTVTERVARGEAGRDMGFLVTFSEVPSATLAALEALLARQPAGAPEPRAAPARGAAPAPPPAAQPAAPQPAAPQETPESSSGFDPFAEEEPATASNPRAVSPAAPSNARVAAAPDARASASAPRAESRAFARVPARLQVSWSSPREFLVAYSDNISRGGIFVATETPPALREIVELFLELPDGQPPARTQAEVVQRVTATEAAAHGGIAGAGLQFIGADAGFGQRLDACIEHLLNA